MPKIPKSSVTVGVGPGDISRPVPQGFTGESLQSLAGSLTQAAAFFENKQNEKDLTEFRAVESQIATSMQNLSVGVFNERDGEGSLLSSFTAIERFDTSAGQTIEGFAEGLEQENPRAAALVREKAPALARIRRLAVIERARTGMGQEVTVEAQKMTENYQQAILGTNLPEEKEVLQARHLSAINSLGFLSAKQKASFPKLLAEGVRDEEDRIKRKEAARISSDVKIAINRAEDFDSIQAATAQMNRAIEIGALPEGERPALVQRLDNKLEKAHALFEERLFMSQVLSGEKFIDPSNKESRAQVNRLFDDVIAPALEELPEEQQLATIQSYIEKTNVVPDAAMGFVRGKMLSTRSEDVVSGSNLLDLLVDIKPSLADEFEPGDLSRSQAIIAFMEDGLPAERAVAFANSSLAGLDSPERKQRNLEYETELVGEDNLENIERVTDRGFFGLIGLGAENLTDAPPRLFGGVDVPVGMLASYDRIHREAYLQYGNEVAADRIAQKAIGSSWGVTDVGGPRRFERFVPERFYPARSETGNHKWIEEQLIDDALERTDVFGKQLTEEEAKNLQLRPDFLTSRDGDFPQYRVMIKTEDEGLQPVLDEDGKAWRWGPDLFRFAETESVDLERRTRTARARSFLDIPRDQRNSFQQDQLDEHSRNVMNMVQTRLAGTLRSF